MSNIPPPSQPGWYADAWGAWWYWDGQGWTPAQPPPGASVAAATAGPQQERSQALLMWILYLVLGGWLAALIFYLMAKDEKRYLRHHAAEALNLAIVLIVPNLVAMGLILGGFLQWVSSVDGSGDETFTFTGLMIGGIALSLLLSVASYGLGILGAVRASQGRWARLPIGFHPVKGVLPADAEPPYDVTG